MRSELPPRDPSLSTTLSQSNQTVQFVVVPPVPLFSCPLSQTAQIAQYEIRSLTFSMPPPAFRTCSINALATTSTSTSTVPLTQQSYRPAHVEDLQRDLDLMKSGERAYLEQFRMMQEDLATRGTTKDTHVIDLDDVDDVGLHDRLRVVAERREAEFTFLSEAVVERDPASGAGGTSQAPSTSASGTGGVVGSKYGQDVEDQKPDIKPGLCLDYFDRLGVRLQERALQKVNKLEEVVEMLQKEKEVKEKEEKEKEARELEKKVRRKAKKLETERELALNRERIVALEQKFFELGNRPPVIAAALPPIANSVSELQNVSGVSTEGTNSNSAAAVSATSALLWMSTLTPPNLPVSDAFNPDIDELILSQFRVVNVDEFKHPSTFDNEDIYGLAVDFGDMGDSFSNLTQQYALMVQAPIVGAQPNLV